MTADEVEELPALSKWWDQVEHGWVAGRKGSEELPLLQRFDYQSQLSAQLPVANHRVIYTASGNTLAAARISGSLGVVEHKLYWASTRSADEARYLVAILNSATLLQRVRPLQAKGLFGPRDFDKYVFHVPFPVYDSSHADHHRIAELAGEAETVAAAVNVDGNKKFTQRRTTVREALAAAGLIDQLEEAVSRVVPEV